MQLFSTRDLEMIQRAQNLKKLSFLVLSGDTDAYKHCMPEIQGMEIRTLPQCEKIKKVNFTTYENIHIVNCVSLFSTS